MEGTTLDDDPHGHGGDASLQMLEGTRKDRWGISKETGEA